MLDGWYAVAKQVKPEQLSGWNLVLCRNNNLPDDASGRLRGSKEWIKGVLGHVPDLRL